MQSQIACGLKKDAVGWTDANIHTIIRRESGNGLQGAILLQGPRLAQITLIMVKVCKNKKEVFSKGSQKGDCKMQFSKHPTKCLSFEFFWGLKCLMRIFQV